MNRPYEPMPPDSDDEVKRLWRAQSVPTNEFSIEELQRTAKRFRRQIVRRNAMEFAACAVLVLVFMLYLIKVPFPLMRAGSALMIAGILVVAWQLRARASTRPIPADLGAQSWLDYHRAQLVRQRDALRSVATWYIGPLIPGCVLFRLGVEIEPVAEGAFARGPIANLLIAAVAIAVVLINRYAARKLQQRIDRLEQETR